MCEYEEPLPVDPWAGANAEALAMNNDIRAILYSFADIEMGETAAEA